MIGMTIKTPGPYTTVQDLGRYGFQNMGVPVSGALDRFSASAANLLVGNPDTAPLLEITVMGPTLEIQKEMDIALTGAHMGFTLNGAPAPQWESVRVNPGDIVAVSMIQAGCRAYLAVTGGIDVPRVMGSAATYPGGKLGGFKGRPLKAGDEIPTGRADLNRTPKKLSEQFIPSLSETALLRTLLYNSGKN